jgi:hypothetical protein
MSLALAVLCGFVWFWFCPHRIWSSTRSAAARGATRTAQRGRTARTTSRKHGHTVLRRAGGVRA